MAGVKAGEQPGQLLFVGFPGTEVPSDLGALVAAGRVGGVVLFARNVRSPGKLRALIDDLHALAPEGAPLTVAIDQEGGRVQRLRAPWTEWPPMARLGESDSPDTTRAVARALGRELADLRIDLDFAPVADVHTNPANPIIGDRSFSSDSAVVARHVALFIEGIQAEGVGACAKHFPGHGDAAADSHVELPRIDCDLARLRAVELPPFRAAVGAGVASVMTAHVLLPAVDATGPATLSRDALALLREDLAFDGVVFGDDLEMAAVSEHCAPGEATRRALAAGVDALLVCSRADLRDAVLAALETAADALVAPGLGRVARLKRRFAGGRHASGASPPYPEHRRLAGEAP